MRSKSSPLYLHNNSSTIVHPTWWTHTYSTRCSICAHGRRCLIWWRPQLVLVVVSPRLRRCSGNPLVYCCPLSGALKHHAASANPTCGRLPVSIGARDFLLSLSAISLSLTALGGKEKLQDPRKVELLLLGAFLDRGGRASFQPFCSSRRTQAWKGISACCTSVVVE